MFKDSVDCIEGHNAGMPVKMVFLPYVQGSTMQEKKKYCASELDHIRKLLTYEPRAGSNAYGVVVTGPVSSDAHFGAIYFDASGWHDMCGHATMCLGSFLVQRKLVQVSDSTSTDIRIDTPAGKVIVHVRLNENGEVNNVSLVNVPSFVYRSYEVEIKGLGKIEIPVAFGADFYGIIDMKDINMKYSRESLPKLLNITSQIFDQLKEQDIVHPLERGVKGLYGIRYQSIVSRDPLKMYGVLFFGSGEKIVLDRSPSGTSSSAHLAYLYFLRKDIELHQEVEFLSSIDTRFIGKVLREVKVAGYDAIVPEISTVDKGCFITGFSTYVTDVLDKLEHGFKPLEPF